MIKSYEYKNQKCFRIRTGFTDEKGKRHQRTMTFKKDGNRITSMREARQLEFDLRNELIQQVQNSEKTISFRNFHISFLDQIKLEYRYNTVMQYECNLLKWMSPIFYESTLDQIKKSDIHDLVFGYMKEKGASPHARKRSLKCLRRIFESALEEGYIARNPAIGLRVKTPPPKKQILNTEDTVKFLEMAKELNHPFYFIWATALLTGMRNGELYALRWSDIDLNSKLITVSSSWSNKDGYHSTKSNKIRVIPISNDLKSLLIELKSIGSYQEELKGLNSKSFFFDDLVLPRSTEWRRGSQASVTRRFCSIIGINEIKFHDLRATFITNLLAQGVSTPKVMSIVGHARMSTTDEYLRLAGVNIKDATERLGYSLPNHKSCKVISIHKGVL